MIIQALLFAFVVHAAEAPNPLVVGAARFTVVTPECVRLEYQKDGRFIDAPSLFAIDRTARADYRLTRSSGAVTIDTGRIKLVYRDDGRPFSRGNLSAEIAGAAWHPGDWSKNDLGGTRNLDGTRGPAPMDQGLLSRDGWRLVDDSESFLLRDDWVAARPKDAGADWYLFGYGHDYQAGLRALTALGGKVPLPRKYVLGSWYSRWWPHSDADYKRIVREYGEHGFPLDVIVLDMDWHVKDDWTAYTWNKKLFPDPGGFLKWAHEQDLAVTLNDHVEGGVQPFEEGYARFMKALGLSATDKKLAYDSGDKKYMDALFAQVLDPLRDLGVDFWWLDYWSDEKEHPFNRLQWVNELYYRRSMHDGLRGQIFSRWGDLGNHRQPVHFSGDVYIDWKTLAFEVPFSANSGNVGAFYWLHDIGGYQGKRDGELLARWTQFGAFSAALRLHSMNKPWLDKRPWSYDKSVEDSMRVSYRLRDELFPYTYSLAWQAYRDSVPLLRPMYLVHPDDDEAYRNPQQYCYGDAFLVAPIVSRRGKQTVWLPAGKWYDWFSGEAVEGGTKNEYARGLDSFPLFVKGGVPIPMQPWARRMASAPLTTLRVRAYPGEDGATGRFTLYEDDGLSTGYQRGEYALTPLEYTRRGDRVTVVIGPQTGDYKGRVERRAYVVELPWKGAVKTIDLPARDAREKVVVETALP